MVSLGMQLFYILSPLMRIYLNVRLVHSLRPSLLVSSDFSWIWSAYISMRVPISPVHLVGDRGSVLCCVYFLDLCIPHRRACNMVRLVLGGKPIFPRRTNLGVGVYGVIWARKDLLVLGLAHLISALCRTASKTEGGRKDDSPPLGSLLRVPINIALTPSPPSQPR